MRIVCLIDSVSRSAGGLFESVRKLAKAMASRSHEVLVLGLQDEHTNEDLSAWHPLRVVTLPVHGPAWLGFSRQLGRTLSDVDADILLNHGLWKYSSMAATRWSSNSKRPYIVHPHGMLDPWAVNHSRWKKRLARLAYENGNLRNAACLRALCDSEANSIRRFGLKGPISVIPNGVDAPESRPANPPPWVDAGDQVLLYLGRLHPKKNLLSLLQAWADTSRERKQSVHWKLVIAGWDQGGYEAQLKHAAKERGIESSVEFIGSQFGEAKAAAYFNASAFILPSLSEGLPMVILEAWSYGKPVLMTPECNIPEGFAANASIQIGTDAPSIAPGLRQLLDMSDADRQTMGERGRQLTLEKFSWPKIAEEMHTVCEWVLGGGPSPCSVRFD